MNEFGQLQLIWIRRLASETGRITALMEAGNLSVIDLVRYKKSISEIDDYCRFVIDAQDWDDVNNIPAIVDEVEEKLFVHFYELIDHFDGDGFHFDFSTEDDSGLCVDFDGFHLGFSDDDCGLSRDYDDSFLDDTFITADDSFLGDVLFAILGDDDKDIFL